MVRIQKWRKQKAHGEQREKEDCTGAPMNKLGPTERWEPEASCSTDRDRTNRPAGALPTRHQRPTSAPPAPLQRFTSAPRAEDDRTGQGQFRGVIVGQAKFPGPRARRKATDNVTAKTWSLNCQGMEGAKAALELAASEDVMILALQEVQMTEKDATKFSITASMRGYTCYHQERHPGEAKTAENGWKLMGGVMLLVSASIPSKRAAACYGTGGQAVFVWIAGTAVASMYAAHDIQRVTFQTSAVEVVGALAPNAKWALLGDFNEEPGASPMVKILELLGGCDRSPEHPTRWDGNASLTIASATSKTRGSNGA